MAVDVDSFEADAVRLDELLDDLSCLEVQRGALHAAVLRQVLAVHAETTRQGIGITAVPQVALALRCSDLRAGRLLADALGLAPLPGALDALATGLLTAETAHAVVVQLDPLPLPSQLAVWRRVLDRLRQDAAAGAVRPPARLTALLRRWVLEVDVRDAVERREAARADRRVELRRREDGLVDLFALGLTAPDAQAVLGRLEAVARTPDGRTADQRRLDGLVDLLLGRHDEGACCPPGSPVPCGASVSVLVPVGTALGATDEPAELGGHGPVEPDLAHQLLAARAVLRRVDVDRRGVPVEVADRTVRPPAGDPDALRSAVLALAGASGEPDEPEGRSASAPPGCHDFPGPYRVPASLRRLLDVRSPLCEWPGCGARAARCDAEHDVAWPLGATCACNLGPCCRRHHRVQQTGWTKARHEDASVTWTSPSGQSWTSTTDHRPLVPLELDHREEVDDDHDRWVAAGRPDEAVAA